MVNIDDYEIIYGVDLIPDTKYIVYRNEETDEVLVFLEKPSDDKYWSLLGLLVTKEYYTKALEAEKHYTEVKENCDSIRSYDEQYDDPSEWYAKERYNKFFKEGCWSDIFWDIII